MRNEEQSGRKQRGLLSITVGLLLIAAALFLASYNLYDELRAEQSARQAGNPAGCVFARRGRSRGSLGLRRGSGAVGER